MTVKERLYQLIDALPESEEETAARILEALSATADSVLFTLDNAPTDDEPDDDDFDAGLTEARAEMRAGRGIPHEEVKRRFGLA